MRGLCLKVDNDFCQQKSSKTLPSGRYSDGLHPALLSTPPARFYAGFKLG